MSIFIANLRTFLNFNSYYINKLFIVSFFVKCLGNVELLLQMQQCKATFSQAIIMKGKKRSNCWVKISQGTLHNMHSHSGGFSDFLIMTHNTRGFNHKKEGQ